VPASILRNQEPLDRDLLNMLAALFDPTPDAHPVIDRKGRLLAPGERTVPE
jgi:hypothetical protein